LTEAVVSCELVVVSGGWGRRVAGLRGCGCGPGIATHLRCKEVLEPRDVTVSADRLFIDRVEELLGRVG
jgi:hypothetical protein